MWIVVFKYERKKSSTMKNYEIDLTFGVDAMHEESAIKKIRAFLSGLDLKKNDKIYLIDPEDTDKELLDRLIDVDDDIDFDDDDDVEEVPKMTLKETDDGEFDADWDELEWEELGKETPPEKEESTPDSEEELNVNAPTEDTVDEPVKEETDTDESEESEIDDTEEPSEDSGEEAEEDSEDSEEELEADDDWDDEGYEEWDDEDTGEIEIEED
tara:strand:+ start:5382 stop:6020 length:639 start_codon:yes stop_codon:yes gene_type:complete